MARLSLLTDPLMKRNIGKKALADAAPKAISGRSRRGHAAYTVGKVNSPCADKH